MWEEKTVKKIKPSERIVELIDKIHKELPGKEPAFIAISAICSYLDEQAEIIEGERG